VPHRGGRENEREGTVKRLAGGREGRGALEVAPFSERFCRWECRKSQAEPGGSGSRSWH